MCVLSCPQSAWTLVCAALLFLSLRATVASKCLRLCCSNSVRRCCCRLWMMACSFSEGVRWASSFTQALDSAHRCLLLVRSVDAFANKLAILVAFLVLSAATPPLWCRRKAKMGQWSCLLRCFLRSRLES